MRGLTHPFPYNDLGKLDALLQTHAGQFAAVIMEPVNFTEPLPGYLKGVQELAHRHGALLIFDEVCSGFHLGLGGAQKRFGVVPGSLPAVDGWNQALQRVSEPEARPQAAVSLRQPLVPMIVVA